MIRSPNLLGKRGVTIPEFSQKNLAWSEILFHEDRTLGAKGCAIFSAFIIAQMMGHRSNPIAFTEELQRLQAFDDCGRLYWNRITHFVPLLPERIRDEESGHAYQSTLTEIEEGHYASIQVRTLKTCEHWMAVIGTIQDDLLIIDPEDGWQGPFKDRYEVSHIIGRTIFRRKK